MKIAIGQSGGPTAVINASLVGFLDSINEDAQLFGIQNGYEGLVNNELINLEGQMLNRVREFKNLPGACLGSGRYKLTDDKIIQAVKHLIKNDIQTIVFIGGNGTMAALDKICQQARLMGYDLQVIGIPKTVDNDLCGTDHAPGFGSAARYVALSARDINSDLESMKNFEQVRILETMGRNAGWLAASSGLLKQSDEDGPHLICLPEDKIEKGHFLSQVKEIVQEYGMATIVMSEGFNFAGESQTQFASFNGRSVLGGISKDAEQLVKQELGLAARAEILGMHQRCSSMAVSFQDRLEAYKTGHTAAEWIKAGKSGVMVSIQRQQHIGYNYILEPQSLTRVANGGEKLLPIEFLTHRDRFYKWLEPLIGDDIINYPPSLKRRIIKHEQTIC
ncbi:diphosphate--fructose-6-phosphate 1-phosphotransferase [Scopulibacillus cellulosilyticus]|uniref:Diphosphate--fructose-6-phosphate 1-phosphotransferase n=1 Tax=Scopulibacillus cellulosilyticus TaxID=2665665 RepID=A0ABW2PY66_9BACL